MFQPNYSSHQEIFHKTITSYSCKVIVGPTRCILVPLLVLQRIADLVICFCVACFLIGSVNNFCKSTSLVLSNHSDTQSQFFFKLFSVLVSELKGHCIEFGVV